LGALAVVLDEEAAGGLVGSPVAESAWPPESHPSAIAARQRTSGTSLELCRTRLVLRLPRPPDKCLAGTLHPPAAAEQFGKRLGR
jgi:hypothetical protein